MSTLPHRVIASRPSGRHSVSSGNGRRSWRISCKVRIVRKKKGEGTAFPFNWVHNVPSLSRVPERGLKTQSRGRHRLQFPLLFPSEYILEYPVAIDLFPILTLPAVPARGDSLPRIICRATHTWDQRICKLQSILSSRRTNFLVKS